MRDQGEAAYLKQNKSEPSGRKSNRWEDGRRGRKRQGSLFFRWNQLQHQLQKACKVKVAFWKCSLDVKNEPVVLGRCEVAGLTVMQRGRCNLSPRGKRKYGNFDGGGPLGGSLGRLLTERCPYSSFKRSDQEKKSLTQLPRSVSGT